MCFSQLSVQCSGSGGLPGTLSNCHSPVGYGNIKPPGLQSQVIKGYSLGGGHQHQAIRSRPAVLWEIPLSCSAEGEHKDGTHWLKQERGGVQRWHLPKTEKERKQEGRGGEFKGGEGGGEGEREQKEREKKVKK